MSWKRKAWEASSWAEEEAPAAKWATKSFAGGRIKSTPLGAANRGVAAGGGSKLIQASAPKAAAPSSFASGGAPAAASRGAGARKRPTGAPFQRVFTSQAEAEVSEAEAEVARYMREELQITVSGEGDEGRFAPLATFAELAEVAPQYLFEALSAAGFEAPMPIQAQALPVALGGKNLVGIAKTGSGKTLAYLLPAIVQIEAQEPLALKAASPIALILAPVRELAVQICEEAKKLVGGSQAGNHPRGLGAACVYGGGSGSKSWQVAEIKKGGHILAATPGRLVDLVDGGEVSLNRVTYFVLDEADRMLEEGFGAQVNHIAKAIRADRQTLFFSATWPTAVQELAEKMCTDGDPPVLVKIGQQEDGAGPTSREDIVQEVIVFDQETWEERDEKKQARLYAHLRKVLNDPSHKALVFVSRKDLADSMVDRLWKAGINAQSMHGGRQQDTRLEILAEFKHGETRLLVTTDVMGRGLDIPDISHVVVYDMGDIEDYVHRIGRTARGPYGEGHALTFFEYDRKWPQIAGEFVQVLEQSGQKVPPALRRIADEVEKGLRETGQAPKRKGSSSWGDGGGSWSSSSKGSWGEAKQGGWGDAKKSTWGTSKSSWDDKKGGWQSGGGGGGWKGGDESFEGALAGLQALLKMWW